MDVRQGNFITREMVSNLRVGMNKETVLQLMGSPSLNHFFERDRWDYYYYLKPGNGDPIEENHLIIYFKANQVVRLEED
jgi:outer membrane protein assembly factor BamE